VVDEQGIGLSGSFLPRPRSILTELHAEPGVDPRGFHRIAESRQIAARFASSGKMRRCSRRNQGVKLSGLSAMLWRRSAIVIHFQALTSSVSGSGTTLPVSSPRKTWRYASAVLAEMMESKIVQVTKRGSRLLWNARVWELSAVL